VRRKERLRGEYKEESQYRRKAALSRGGSKDPPVKLNQTGGCNVSMEIL
jgi:hypothetical protein